MQKNPLGASRAGSELVFLALGSNLGNRTANLAKALELLSESGRVLYASAVYSTIPIGMAGKRVFNQIILFQTTVSPELLLTKTQDVEIWLGRAAGEKGKSQPRTIDIDILSYGRRGVKAPNLTLPHPKLFSRFFVLMPLSELLVRMEKENPALYDQLDPRFTVQTRSSMKKLTYSKHAIRRLRVRIG